MLYGDNVQDTRALFFSSWKKYKHRQPLLALEQQLVDVILMHPEYQAMLEKNPKHPESFYSELGQTNPFLHMGLHLAIRDQVMTDRPSGITDVYQTLMAQHHDVSTVEHLLMEHLGECLWLANQNQCMPDEAAYLRACQQIL